MSVTPPLPRIHKLPESVSNQIAAGEIIERPASVVKELIENSFDAGAAEVTIDLLKGGLEQIRIRDNGHGIHPDDLALALTSHATSKLKDIGDLARISSLGFRGEALPSIASVARLKIISRARGFEHGCAMSIDPAGGEINILPAPHPVGTTVEVNKLFHVLPARRKFLRSEKTEYLHVLEMIRCMALSRFDVTLRMNHNGKQVFFTRGSDADPDNRVKYILGQAFTRAAIAMDYRAHDMRLWGWIGPSSQHRSQTDRQYFFLNGRLIRDRRVNHAIRAPYEEQIPAGRYPVYVLYLEMDRAASDVNVHPTKHEVRFRDARDVHDFISASLRDSLTAGRSRTGAVREETRTYTSVSAGPAYMDACRPDAPSRLGQPLNLLLGRYILTRRSGCLLLVDTKTAMQHIMGRRLKVVSVQNPLKSRPLLVPVEIAINQEHAPVLEEFGDVLSVYGLSLTLISPVSVLIKSIPVILEGADLATLIRELLVVLSRDNGPREALHTHINTVFTGQAAAFNHDHPNTEEMVRLLQSLEDCGLDLDRVNHPGLWTTLDQKTINSLIHHA